MQSQFFRILGVLVFFASVGSSHLAFADGWTWGPFSKSSSSRDSSPLYSSSSSTNKSSWLPTMKMPKMPWSSSNSSKMTSYSRSNTSTWGKMSKASKRWWNKTTELLDPYPEPKPQTYSTGSDKKAKPGIFQSWFSPKEPEGPRTANEFLGDPPLKY